MNVTTISFFVRQINSLCTAVVCVHVLSPLITCLVLHSMLYFLITFFFSLPLVITWYPVVFSCSWWLKMWWLFMGRRFLAFGAQLHSRIESTRYVFWEQRGDYRHCGGRFQKIQSISIYQRGSFSKIAVTKNVSVFTFNHRRHRSTRRENSYHKTKTLKQNKYDSLVGNQVDCSNGSFGLYTGMRLFLYASCFDLYRIRLRLQFGQPRDSAPLRLVLSDSPIAVNQPYSRSTKVNAFTPCRQTCYLLFFGH